MACRAQCLKVLDPVHDRRVEDRSFGDTFDVVRLKFLPTAAQGTLPSIPLKRQKAVGEIDFIIVLGRNRLDVGHVYDWVVVLSEMLVTSGSG